MKKKIFLFPLFFLIILLAFSGIRLFRENRLFYNHSFFLDVTQYLASYLDEEVLITLTFIDSNNRVANHQLEGHPLILISEDGETFTIYDYQMKLLKEANFFSPYSIFGIDIAFELERKKQQVLFNQIKMGGYVYEIGEVMIEKIPPIGDLQFGIGATTFSSRVNQLELSISNGESKEAIVKGVFIYLEGQRVNFLRAPVLLLPEDVFDYSFDLHQFEHLNFSIVPKVEIEFSEATVFLRTPNNINLIDDISKEVLLNMIIEEEM